CPRRAGAKHRPFAFSGCRGRLSANPIPRRRPMFDQVVAYLEKRIEANAINPDPFARRQVAVASLLIEASRLDGHYDATEQGTVVRLLRETLQLPPEQARTLHAIAEA